ncbi:MAG: nucleotidyltransferase domain-containing protein [Candidatus Methanoplasma sp.]|jgi:predicted nucleotidyltransferase|nr:nucleotidyltransferase domain-containing protein [Candidatus Methanoplasma sp.]
MAIEKKMVDKAVRRIVEDYDPKAVILFGSVANGTDREDSDIDLMVIMDSDMPRFERSVDVRFTIGMYSAPIDILAFTPEEFEERRNDKYSVVYEALHKGVVLYGSA